MPNNGLIKQLHTKGERRLVESYLISFKKQLEEIPKYNECGGYGSQSYRWTELNAKKEFCEKLLGV